MDGRKLTWPTASQSGFAISNPVDCFAFASEANLGSRGVGAGRGRYTDLY
jgi:hypothetical protein